MRRRVVGWGRRGMVALSSSLSSSFKTTMWGRERGREITLTIVVEERLRCGCR